MTCLRCGRTVTGFVQQDFGKDFCSARCAEEHRRRILARLDELRDEQAQISDWHAADLFTLGQSVRANPTSGVQRAEVEFASPAKPRGRIITFFSAQGGSGASTISLHTAEALARSLNQRVLLIEFDFHSGTTALRLGIEPPGSLQEVLSASAPPAEVLKQSVARWGLLDVLVPRSGGPRSDFTRLDKVLEATLNHYAAVVIDHPDAVYTSSRPVLRRSAAVYLVCTPDIAGLHLARRKRREISLAAFGSEHADSALRLIVNRCGSWGALDLADVEKVTGLAVAAKLSNDYRAVRKANWVGGLVEPGSNLAREFQALADRVSRDCKAGPPRDPDGPIAIPRAGTPGRRAVRD